MKPVGIVAGLAAIFPVASACGSGSSDSCFGPVNHVEHVRHVKRMQPGAQGASYGPSRPLEWGQLNILHTTDTHGWLEGHLKEKNYGADFGDYVTFAKHMKHRAGNMGVDMLIVDTGDLHDGTGLSDATTPDGELSNKVFEELDYDLLTIGNHELYVTEVAYQVFDDFSKFWGDKYLTSNVQALNPATGTWDYIGKTYKYFTTQKGLRIMAFGILYDFTGNTNVTKVIPAATMVQQDWFKEAITTTEPVDVFLLLGHNIARPSTGGSTFGIIHDAIRKVHPKTPIQIFGGHSHIRDFAVLDESSTALESGRYCETLGWFSMSGFDSSNSGFTGVKNPRGVANPTRKATNTSTSPFVYSRRYLDWNRYTFEYHAVGKQDDGAFDYNSGTRVTNDITEYRKELNLGELYGCVPDSYCQTCVPFNDPKNIFTLLADALATSVVNPARADKVRYVYCNTGGIRFDLYKGPFTYDDNFIVSPFRDVWLYIPDVPYDLAEALLAGLNAGGASKKRFASTPVPRETCADPVVAALSEIKARGLENEPRGVSRRQVVDLDAGYTTTDDFGTDGDDTAHSKIPSYRIPNYFQGVANLPTTGTPQVADIVFVDFIEPYVLAFLGANFTSAMVTPYVSENFTSQDYLIPYAKAKWQANVPNCPI
ncbi:hypothetical protein CONLIGDRAFT_677571 [Coniochaeta ligniaria NRRL 30616]|uniref:Uncharacterized protein n=1 Tax=Coniochaeta ligniaria NRRL 30616 TaxID=1408157 RepID=A0A1J7J392_9PEZI|nr:hypothetical protein CONLIGDRAFT_677571 [Coniochaeta ligniaria NRRL 30616]